MFVTAFKTADAFLDRNRCHSSVSGSPVCKRVRCTILSDPIDVVADSIGMSNVLHGGIPRRDGPESRLAERAVGPPGSANSRGAASNPVAAERGATVPGATKPLRHLTAAASFRCTARRPQRIL